MWRRKFGWYSTRRRCGSASDELPGEAVSGFANRENVSRIRGIALELAPQLGHVRVHRPAHHFGAVAPHFAEQLRARYSGAVAADERQQQIILLGRERNG